MYLRNRYVGAAEGLLFRKQSATVAVGGFAEQRTSVVILAEGDPLSQQVVFVFAPARLPVAHAPGVAGQPLPVVKGEGVGLLPVGGLLVGTEVGQHARPVEAVLAETGLHTLFRLLEMQPLHLETVGKVNRFADVAHRPADPAGSQVTCLLPLRLQRWQQQQQPPYSE